EDWQPRFDDREETEVFIAHGRRDPIIEIDFARRARELLEAGGLRVEYLESDVAHQIDPAHLEAARGWIERAVPSGA
ncbi:MAG TPA: phospholipase, partial [Solirubrobacterales bacterium]|nr:phospholipase [Solirubrobacterales bacterium]